MKLELCPGSSVQTKRPAAVLDLHPHPRPGLRGHTPLISPHAFVEPVPWFSTFALTYASRSAPRLSPPLEAERFELHLGYVSTAQSRIPPLPQSAPFLHLHMTAVVCPEPLSVCDACTVIKPSDYSQLPLSASFGFLPVWRSSNSVYCCPPAAISFLLWANLTHRFHLLMGAAHFTSPSFPHMHTTFCIHPFPSLC